MLRIRDVYPGSGFFPIPDPTKRGGKFFFFNLFNFLPTNYELRVYGLLEDNLCGYKLCEYDLCEYDLHEYDLHEYDLREYDLLSCEKKNI